MIYYWKSVKSTNSNNVTCSAGSNNNISVDYFATIIKILKIILEIVLKHIIFAESY